MKSGACLPHRQVPVRIPQDRYKGIAKNAAQVFSLMALANLYQARGALLAVAG